MIEENPIKDVIEQLETIEELIDYILETDKVIAGFVEEDDPKSIEELNAGTREQLVNYLTMRVAYLKMLIDGDTIH